MEAAKAMASLKVICLWSLVLAVGCRCGDLEIRVESEPPGAMVTIDGMQRGRTPIKVLLDREKVTSGRAIFDVRCELTTGEVASANVRTGCGGVKLEWQYVPIRVVQSDGAEWIVSGWKSVLVRFDSYPGRK